MNRDIPPDPNADTPDIQMMQEPARWPQWPLLPMVRRGKGYPDAGVLVCKQEGLTGTVEPRVYFANMWEGVRKDTPTKLYESFQAIIEDDWEVD